ncbi:MAG: hypothetical protein KBT82_01990 [Marinobacter sp.]|uniref:hypothetical protein n=1 Tax=Marinobacter sp. TaxID=50741 RepID=UPI001B4B8D67|nr:hypothetical protein [Marinobacter sp.]MBQ0745267.1 hypothetical protein [Marinobacter sp.]MBQ0812949.1 hypothetical protein [Marinobacter sp.]|tara:strand:- start:904 stop:1062 length:159 start_codon:yes stop_codon:yes gene_type:complete
MKDHGPGFLAGEGLEHALALLRNPPSGSQALPDALPERGIGEIEALNKLARA